MKIKPIYKLRTVGGTNIVVSTNGMNFSGIITVNDTAKFIWRKIESGAQEEEIVNSLAVECDISADEIREEVHGFIEKLKGAGVIE